MCTVQRAQVPIVNDLGDITACRSEKSEDTLFERTTANYSDVRKVFCDTILDNTTGE